MIKEINCCRICKNPDLISIVNLGDQALTGIFPKTKEEIISIGPLDLVKCNVATNPSSCGLVQLRHSFDHNEMYGDNYGYRSGLNQSMVNHLHDITSKIQSFVKLNPGDTILDIGSNDSTLLSSYPQNLTLLGIDPTGSKFKKYYPSHIQLNPTFFSEAAYNKHFPSNTAKVVTSIAMFYDLEDPIKFMQDIYNVLAEDGIWLFEQSYLISMLEANAYDTICHEHVEYYALKQIQYMCKKVGFKILDIEINDINGGSFQIICAKEQSQYTPNTGTINAIYDKEEKTLQPLLQNFKNQIVSHRSLLVDLLNDLQNKGKRVFGYGASTKGNVVLQYCQFDDQMIPYIAEVNPDKYGSFTPGTKIPIISESEAKSKKPDYFLVLPWHFKDNIIEREHLFLSSGGKLIFPLPEINIVGG